MINEIINSERAVMISSNPINDIDYLNNELSISKEILKAYPNWYEIDGELYYFKEITDIEKLINELVGVKIARYFRLKSISYNLAIKEGNKSPKIGLISKSIFDHDKEYKNLYDIVSKNVYGLPVKNCLEEVINLCQTTEEKEKVFLQILRMTTLDFYTNQVDRVFQNIDFQVKPNISLAPLYDYSETFDTESYGEKRQYTFVNNYYWYKNFNYIYQNDLLKLTFPSEKLYDLFDKYPQFYKNFTKILDLDLKKYLIEIQKENDINLLDIFLQYYMEYDEQKKEFVRKII